MQSKYKIAIFLIDDDAEMRVMLDRLLRENNIVDYTIYSDPVKLLEELHKDVQLCVIDYNLRHSTYDGLLLMKQILKTNSYCKCIIMTAYDDAQTIKAFQNAGSYRYIVKGEPSFAENLISYIRSGIELIAEAVDFYSTLLTQMRDTCNQLKAIKDGAL